MSSSPPQAPPRQSSVTVYEDTSWERMFSTEVGRLIAYVRPWLALGMLFPIGYPAPRFGGHMPAVPWAASGLALAAVALGCFSWGFSRLAPIGRAHSAAT